ncbi:hypothetical protein PF008_g28304 [Phytophthora fragariae]|uniref:Secreted protein n=1 Tax=Phytophthora fragariae TaxID=53985 RepID=A0A6G0QBM8_9STRA|nr:hypothetical protein PF008_g28304 [Phytophthora fragariae]
MLALHVARGALLTLIRRACGWYHWSRGQHKVSSRRSNESSVGCKLWLRKKNSTRVGRRTLAPSSAFCHDSGGIDCASNVGRIPNHSDQAWRAVHRELNDGEGETCCFSLALRPGALPSYQPRQKCAD